MPVTNWNTTYIDGKPFLVIDVAKFRIPLEWDPSSNMFLAVAAPDGGLGNFPALVQGDPGDTPDIDLDIDLTVLDYDDPTPEFASWDEIAPNVYKLSIGLRRGAPGMDGVMVLTPTEYGTPVAGRMLVVTPDLSGFEYAAQKVGDRYVPASLANVPTGNTSYTICPIGIPAQPFDWRPEIEGQQIVTGTASDVRADLFARLETPSTINGETAGPVIGRGAGPLGTNAAGIPTIFSSAPPANSDDNYDKVLAGDPATIYVRLERIAGTGTFSTVNTNGWFKVKVAPIP